MWRAIETIGLAMQPMPTWRECFEVDEKRGENIDAELGMFDLPVGSSFNDGEEKPLSF